MPRKARRLSSTAVYHIIVRGINKQVIFHGDDDYEKFIHVLFDTKEKSKFKLYAYCLMNNHVHLLIQENSEEIAVIMKRMLVSYAAYYNRKYSRIGPLFQDRFKSHPVEDEAYLHNSIRYIHQNPLRAGLVEDVFTFQYSSAHEYYFRTSYLTDIDFMLKLMEYNHFIKFQNEPIAPKELIKTPVYRHYSDTVAIEIACSACCIDSIDIIKKLPDILQDECILIMLRNHLPGAQISRITGFPKHRIVRLKSDPRAEA